jgi:hypothetical protein
MRHVCGNEIYASLLQPEQEMRVARQSVELGDDEFGAVDAARCKLPVMAALRRK